MYAEECAGGKKRLGEIALQRSHRSQTGRGILTVDVVFRTI